jgi:hypothetical protein
MAGVGHQRGGMGDEAVGEFDDDKADIENDGNQEGAAVVARLRMMVTMVMMPMVMIVMVVGMRMRLGCGSCAEVQPALLAGSGSMQDSITCMSLSLSKLRTK